MDSFMNGFETALKWMAFILVLVSGAVGAGVAWLVMR